MKTRYYNVVFVMLMFPLVVFGNIGRKKGRYSEEKLITKEFIVSKDALLKVNNSYGNIDIAVWDQEKISIKVTIKVHGNDTEKTQEKLEDINVNFSASPSEVVAMTELNGVDSNTSWWNKIASSISSFSGNNDNVNVEIHYNIKMPVTNKLDVVNDYGSINIDENLGGCKINCDYGQLIIGELKSNNNQIHMDYSNNSSIKYIKKATINADYSDFSIYQASELDLSADYSKSSIEKADLINFKCDYGSLKLGEIGVLKGNGDYVSIRIKSIDESVGINSDYGSITIDHLKSSVKTVLIKTDYSGVRINYDPELSFKFNLKTSFGGIQIDDGDMTVMNNNEEHTNRKIEGFRGSQNSGVEIMIGTFYGNIDLLKL